VKFVDEVPQVAFVDGFTSSRYVKGGAVREVLTHIGKLLRRIDERCMPVRNR
jgi:hypothetical protein